MNMKEPEMLSVKKRLASEFASSVTLGKPTHQRYSRPPFPHILDLALENLLALLPLLALHTSACGKPASTIVQADTYSFKASVLNQVFFGGWGCASSFNLKNGLILTSRRYSE